MFPNTLKLQKNIPSIKSTFDEIDLKMVHKICSGNIDYSNIAANLPIDNRNHGIRHTVSFYPIVMSIMPII